MPELPEVEHVVRALRPELIGRRIEGAELRLKRTAPETKPATFNRKLRGSTIESIGRRGKHILINLNSGLVLIVHLRMTGKFVALDPDQTLPPHAHAVFYLDNERRLVFSDMRQFGRMTIVAAGKLMHSAQVKSLAPEPLDEDFSFDYFRSVLRRSTRALKNLLLDQTKVLGLGNIYASEALFLARVSPFAAANSVSKHRALRLYTAIRETLREAIESGSTLQISLADRNGSYVGNAERFWRVYEREGEPCVNCGSKIRRAVQGGRSTYYCPRCQR
jgi:formamidopyrimidine-DNA glycosylase